MIEPMEIEISGALTNDQSLLIKQVILETLVRARALLFLNDIKFQVIIDDSLAIPEWGVGGYCENSRQIDLALSPNRESDWKRHLPRTIAHEWHHIARWRGPGYGTTLATVIISEGLAQHFEVDCFPGPPSFFSSFLNDRNRASILASFIREFNAPEFDHRRWFFGKGEFPFQAGYDLSFAVLGEYLAKKNTVAAKEVGMSPEQLLEVLPTLSL